MSFVASTGPLNPERASEAAALMEKCLPGYDKRQLEETVGWYMEGGWTDVIGVYTLVEGAGLVGIALFRMRHGYAEGTAGLTGFLDGIYMEEKWRELSFLPILIRGCMHHAESKGCGELVSWCEPNDCISENAHEEALFEEKAIVLRYRTVLECEN